VSNASNHPDECRCTLCQEHAAVEALAVHDRGSVIEVVRRSDYEAAMEVLRERAVICGDWRRKCEKLEAALEKLDKACRNADALLCNIAQIMDVVKIEWEAENAWSEWDQQQRDDITAVMLMCETALAGTDGPGDFTAEAQS
jgi:hypothetical protein